MNREATAVKESKKRSAAQAKAAMPALTVVKTRWFTILLIAVNMFFGLAGYSNAAGNNNYNGCKSNKKPKLATYKGPTPTILNDGAKVNGYQQVLETGLAGYWRTTMNGILDEYYEPSWKNESGQQPKFGSYWNNIPKGNDQRLPYSDLPLRPAWDNQSQTYYREYDVNEPGIRHRGEYRIVCGGWNPFRPDNCYSTSDHYHTFQRIIPEAQSQQ